jgi:hypothetical protein
MPMPIRATAAAVSRWASPRWTHPRQLSQFRGRSRRLPAEAAVMATIRAEPAFGDDDDAAEAGILGLVK